MIALLLALTLAPQDDDAAATEAIATFDATFSKSKDAGSRGSAITALSKTHHEKVVSRLAVLLTHEEKALKIAAAQALATFKEPDAARKSAAHALGSALGSGSNAKENDVQVAIFTAIGHLEEESSGTLLKNHFDDRDPEIAQAAIMAAGALKSKALVEPLIEELRDCEKKSKVPDAPPASGKVTRTPKGGGGGGGSSSPSPDELKRQRAQQLLPAVQGALSTLTGQNLSLSTDWDKWWSKNRASFNPTK
ncbi:MAG TPA: HEAT repeat domain-containing protein [Planctomycetota bacterium]|nr:HEAT repeat domain-containing protein [Planctomycetota bacterium]